MKVRHEFEGLGNPFTDVFFGKMLSEPNSVLTLKLKILQYIEGALKSAGIGDSSAIEIGIDFERDIYYVYGKNFYSALLLQGLYVPEVYDDDLIVKDQDDYYCWDSKLHKCTLEDVGAHKIVVPTARFYERPKSSIKIEFVEKIKEIL
jgi:hypothetical protein